jgi:hypothetical protein
MQDVQLTPIPPPDATGRESDHSGAPAGLGTQFVASRDGTRIAYEKVGRGPTLVLVNAPWAIAG